MAQKDAIAEVQARHPAIRIFTGVESDILADGSLDYDADVLAGVDAVVASVHSRFTLDEDSQTRRLVRAVSHPATAFLGHPTGRLLLSREGYPHRWEDVVTAAAKCATAIELNANPHRLDVDWTRIPGLRDAGIRIGINPDAHSPEGLKDVRYGIIAARKGLARKRDVVNTMDTDDMAAYLSDRKDGRS
jgi:DNA polymerase (family 10)